MEIFERNFHFSDYVRIISMNIISVEDMTRSEFEDLMDLIHEIVYEIND